MVPKHTGNRFNQILKSKNCRLSVKKTGCTGSSRQPVLRVLQKSFKVIKGHFSDLSPFVLAGFQVNSKAL